MFGNTLLPSLLVTLVAPSPQDQEAPPGLVLIKGGRTKIGTDLKEIEPLILANEQLANALAGETPQHQVKVDDFYLMVSEVTNEQYAEYVSATGAQPPYYWGKEALDAAREAFLKEDGRLAAEARQRGERYDRKKFEPAPWWEDNWKNSDWEVPADKLDSPVVYISYADAQAYSRWAGLRLMSEYEYTRAARGDSEDFYPWGEDWDATACNSLEYKERDDAMPVGSFEKGAVNGIHDLVGNVWEWTSSRYTSFPKYKMISIKTKGKRSRAVEAMAGFDPNQRVAVGGSYFQTAVGVRLTTRRGSDRTQRTDGTGFRCAASTTAGKDSAEWTIAEDVNMAVLGSDYEFYSDGALVLQRWETGKGTSEIPGYAVITKYENTFFCPVKSLPASSVSELRKKTTDDGPLFLGVVCFAYPTMEPQLDAGNYLVAWRGEGKLKDTKEEESTAQLRVGGDQDQDTIPFWEVPGFDPDVDCLLLYTLSGQPVIAFPAEGGDFKRMKEGGKIAVEAYVPPDPMPKPDEPQPIPMDTLRFSMAVAGKRPTQGLFLDLAIKVAPNSIDDSWQ